MSTIILQYPVELTVSRIHIKYGTLSMTDESQSAHLCIHTSAYHSPPSPSQHSTTGVKVPMGAQYHNLNDFPFTQVKLKFIHLNMHYASASTASAVSLFLERNLEALAGQENSNKQSQMPGFLLRGEIMACTMPIASAIIRPRHGSCGAQGVHV